MHNRWVQALVSIAVSVAGLAVWLILAYLMAEEKYGRVTPFGIPWGLLGLSPVYLAGGLVAAFVGQYGARALMTGDTPGRLVAGAVAMLIAVVVWLATAGLLLLLAAFFTIGAG